jgi:MYXO-CTERM domain-containing protein
MKSFLSKSALAIAAMACVGAAQAAVIDFEEAISSPFAPFAPLFGHGDEFYQGEYWLDPFSNSAAAQAGDLVGALVDGTDLANTCFGITCPVNNASHFYAGLNDGALVMGSMFAGHTFKVNGFDASFVGAAGNALPGISGLLRLQGHKADGSGSITQTYQLPGPDQAGNLNFFSYQTSGLFADTEFDYMYVFGFACNAAGSCSAFSSDLGQFAIDNINLTNIPEPTGLALAALGLVGVGATRRRQA